MNASESSPQPADQRLRAALDEYRRRVDAGEQIDRDSFLARYGEGAAELRKLIEEATRSTPEQRAVSESTRSVTKEDTLPTRAERGDRREEALPEIFGRYRIIKQLGQGSMGAVYLAHDTELDRRVALKTPSSGATDEQALGRFLREARTAATLHHRNICPVYDAGAIDGTRYITMAFIEGRPLSDYIGRERLLAERKVAAVVRKIALALAEAHEKGIVHRDLKPSNVVIDAKGEPVVMDFGLARRYRQAGGERLTQSGIIVGTPAYMAPEQVDGDPVEIGPASDVYSLGVILYELLTGRVPFEGSVASVLAQIIRDEPRPPSQLRPDLDGALNRICMTAIQKEAGDRYASMREFAGALTEYLKGTSSAPTGTVEIVPEPADNEPPPTSDEAPSRDRSSLETSPKHRKGRVAGRWEKLAWLTAGAAVAICGAGLFFLLRPGPPHNGAIGRPAPPGQRASDGNNPPPTERDRQRESERAGPADAHGPAQPPPPPAGGRFETRFDHADHNGDGKLDPNEFPLHVIHRADSDGDELLSEKEYDEAYRRLGSDLFAPPDGPPPRPGPFRPRPGERRPPPREKGAPYGERRPPSGERRPPRKPAYPPDGQALRPRGGARARGLRDGRRRPAIAHGDAAQAAASSPSSRSVRHLAAPPALRNSDRSVGWTA